MTARVWQAARVWQWLIVAVASVVLAGCRIDVTVDVAVQPNGSGMVTLTAVADKAVVEEAAGLANDLRLDDAKRAGWTVAGPDPTEAGGLQVVLTRPFANVNEATKILSTINGPNGPLHDVALSRTADGGRARFDLAGTLRIDGDLSAFADIPLMNSVGGKAPWSNKVATADRTKVVGMTLRIHLPGAVTSAASRDGNALVWTAPYGGQGEPLASSATVAAGSGSAATDGPSGFWQFLSRFFLVVLVLWLVIAGVLVTKVVNVQRRRARRRDQLMAYRARNLGN